LAVRGGAKPMPSTGHLHGDLNSFILVHRNERLLADAGHCCYRNLIHELDKHSQTHNTCTFTTSGSSSVLPQEEQLTNTRLTQSTSVDRITVDPATRQLTPPADRGARRLLAERCDDVTVIASEAAALYGPM